MTKVEEVARALCEAVNDDWNHPVMFQVDPFDTLEQKRDVYRRQARAAIEALREPTPEMVAAGEEYFDTLEAYQAMMAAALGESE